VTTPLPLSEKQFQAQVTALARLAGWKVFHTYDSRRSPHGFPDLVLVRAPRVIFCELKSAAGRPTPAQVAWLADLARCPGVETYLWKPADWDELAASLTRR
jgi:hypothetical protein